MSKITPKQIKIKRKAIEEKIEFHKSYLKYLQEICPHENLNKEFKSYCPGELYWTDYNCKDCGLSWRGVE